MQGEANRRYTVVGGFFSLNSIAAFGFCVKLEEVWEHVLQ
jgi:hypothetical protein